MPKSILLATDNPHIAYTFKGIAQRHALSVEVVSSVSDAVMAFVQSMHDWVFLSLALEGGKGMHLVKELASLAPRIVLLGERREGFAHIELPLEEPKVLACLGLAPTKPSSTQPPQELAPAPKPIHKTTTLPFAPEPARPVEHRPSLGHRPHDKMHNKAEEVLEAELVQEHMSALPGKGVLGFEEKANAEAKYQQMEKTIASLEGRLQTHRRIHGKLEAELAKSNAEIALLKSQGEAALLTEQELKSALELFQREKEQAQEEAHKAALLAEQELKSARELFQREKEQAQEEAHKATLLAEQELKSARELFQQEREQSQEEAKRIGVLLERTLEERTLWQEEKGALSLEIQQVKEAVVQLREEKDLACLKLAEVQEQWKESEGRLQSALSASALVEAENEALKAHAEQAQAHFEKKNAEFEQQALSYQKRMTRMEEELVQLRSYVNKAEAEVRAALAMAPSTVILPLSSPMPGNVFSTFEECLGFLVQTVAARPWLRLDIESRMGRRKLYIRQGSLVGVDSNCPDDLLLRQARRDGLINSKQYQSLRLLEERSPHEQLEVLLKKGFIREMEIEGLLQRYIEKVAFEAMSQKEAAFALAEEKPGGEVTVLKKPQPLWPLLKAGIEGRDTEAHFLERFGGMEAIPVLKTSLAGLVAMGIGKMEMRFFESVDGETKLEALLEDFSFQPKQVFSILLTAWKLGVIEFSNKVFMDLGAFKVSTERLFARFEEIRDADYFDVLGVSQAASTKELGDARMRLVEEFNPLKFAGHGDPKALACAEQLTALVEEAFGVLEDEMQRKEYAHHLMGNG